MNNIRPLTSQFVLNLKTHRLETDAKRNLILLILRLTTTKREARNYLNKYRYALEDTLDPHLLRNRDSQSQLFVNRFLDGAMKPFGTIRLGEYVDDTDQPQVVEKIPLRIALFRINYSRVPESCWKGIGETFRRLQQFGVLPVVVLDFDHLARGKLFKYNEQYILSQSTKLVNKMAELKVNCRLIQCPDDELMLLLLVPLYQNAIPIVLPIFYNKLTSQMQIEPCVDVLQLMISLLTPMKDLLSIEKIVFLDPQGGIPSIERNQTSHVFINLTQELTEIQSELYIGHLSPKVRDIHLKNLESMNKLLKAANGDTTGIITTPEVMAVHDDIMNPIVYNVLTDRAVISLSLPPNSLRTPEISTSILKRGVLVEIWDASVLGREFTLNELFSKGLVDKRKLVDLLQDLFGKPLDVDNYFNRIDHLVATLVIVGDYDGLAIITWETAPQGGKKVAYLDKFAIAKRNQGLPGLADIIFKIIVQAHPEELLWRLRQNNPVNKWYFERCCGSVCPDDHWRLFFTGAIFGKKLRKNADDLIDIGEKVRHYLGICLAIKPSFLS